MFPHTKRETVHAQRLVPYNALLVNESILKALQKLKEYFDSDIQLVNTPHDVRMQMENTKYWSRGRVKKTLQNAAENNLCN